MNPICAYCRVEFRCAQNEHIVETVCNGEPYKLHSCDRFECPSCHASILIGFAPKALADAGDPHYEAVRNSAENGGRYTRIDQ